MSRQELNTLHVYLQELDLKDTEAHTVTSKHPDLESISSTYTIYKHDRPITGAKAASQILTRHSFQRAK